MLPTTMPELSNDFDTPEFASGLPADRRARIAARRAFVDLKLLFMRAVEPLQDRKGQWLKDKVRLAHEPIDLWLLRGPILQLLNSGQGSREMRAEFYRGLDSVFPDTEIGRAHV